MTTKDRFFSSLNQIKIYHVLFNYVKIINTFGGNGMCPLKQIVWETKKWHENFGRPSSSLVIDQNNILHDSINNSKTAWPTEI